jgi:hypothetical protein
VKSKGGYQAPSRLESAIDEIAMEATAAMAESPHKWKEAFEEIARLARDAKGLIAYMNGKPPMALAGAG